MMILEKIKILSIDFPLLGKVLKPLFYIWKNIIFRRKVFEDRFFKNLSFVLSDDPIVRLDEFKGIFSVDSRSDLFRRIVLLGSYETPLVGVCLKYLDKDRDVIDVGANVGFYTVLFAKSLRDGKVLSIEPTRSALSRLVRNIQLNQVEARVDIFRGVAADSEGIRGIKTISGKEEYSSMGNMSHPVIDGCSWDVEQVNSTTIDILVASKRLNPGFIKVDVEGVENIVFNGARETLEKFRPVVLSELCDYLLRRNGSSAKEVVAFFEDCGYRVIDPEVPTRKPGSGQFGDILCIPREKM